jgi:DNA-binding protein HU-beta
LRGPIALPPILASFISDLGACGEADPDILWRREFGVGIRRLTKYKQGEYGESPTQGADQEQGEANLKKTELIEAIAEKTDAPKSQAQKHLDAFEEVVTDTLKGGDEVQITGFGKFYVREQKARDGRNPQTGEKMRIPAQKVPTFSAGNSLKDSI